MGGNRKHGFRRGNGGGVKPQPWTCDGCGKTKRGGDWKNVQLDRRCLCDTCDGKELATRDLRGTHDLFSTQ
jgi:hypothetical protein